MSMPTLLDSTCAINIALAMLAFNVRNAVLVAGHAGSVLMREAKETITVSLKRGESPREASG